MMAPGSLVARGIAAGQGQDRGVSRAHGHCPRPQDDPVDAGLEAKGGDELAELGSGSD